MEPRRLNLVDGMMLVAGLASGLAIDRWYCGQPGLFSPSELSIGGAADLGASILLTLSFALIAVRLRRPRPVGRRLCRQAGFQASLLVGLAATAELVNARWFLRPHPVGILWALSCGLVDVAGPIVAIGWILARLARARRPEPGPIDRLGRALGWAWIALWIVRIALEDLPPLVLGPPEPLPSSMYFSN